MLSLTPKVILAASCFFFHLKSLSAAPVVEVVKVIQVRQENGDDDGGAITDPLRNGQCQHQTQLRAGRNHLHVHPAYSYSQVFLSNNPTWYTISTFGGTLSGSYKPYFTGTPKPTPPATITAAQGTNFNVDHVLELQVVASFVQSANPNP